MSGFLLPLPLSWQDLRGDAGMSNIRITRAIRIALGLLRQEMGSVRVIMGYLLGFTVLALGLNDFLRYAVEIEEPVNIFEAFSIGLSADFGECAFCKKKHLYYSIPQRQAHLEYGYAVICFHTGFYVHNVFCCSIHSS